MFEFIDESTKIEDIKTLPSRIKEKFTPYFVTIKDIVDKSVEELVSLEGILLIDVAGLLKLLNANDIHLKDEEKVNLEDFWNPETSELMKEYSQKIAERNNISFRFDNADTQDKFQYAQEVYELELKIQELFAKIERARESSSRRK